MTIEKQTYRFSHYKDRFAQCIKNGNILYLAGQIVLIKREIDNDYN